MDTGVQGDILRDHLLQLIHDGLDGILGGCSLVLIPRDGDLVLGGGGGACQDYRTYMREDPRPLS